MVYQIPPNGIRNPVGPRFRGEWRQWGEVIKYEDFSTHPTPPEDLVTLELGVGGEVLPTGSLSMQAMPDTPWTSRPDLSGALAARADLSGVRNNRGTSYLEVHLDQMGLPEGYEITRISFDVFTYSSNGQARHAPVFNRGNIGDVEYWNSTTAAWRGPVIVRSPDIPADSTFGIAMWGVDSSSLRTMYTGITGITIWGIPEGDRYILGDTVSYQGQLWRNLVNGNNDEPGTSSRWEKVSHTLLPPDLRSLNDVDLVGLYDRANLTYWAEDQKWHPGDKTEDQRNFRGDWQDPADTLLWASDFSNPADRDFFVESTTGEIQSLTVDVVLTESSFSTENNPSEFYQNQLRYRHAVSGSGTGRTELTFDLGQVLTGRYVSRFSYWSAVRRVSTNSSYGVDHDPGGGAWTSGVGAAALRDWEETVYEVSRLSPVLKWRTVDSLIQSSSAGNLLEWNLTGFKVYGAASNDDLYGLNDVTYHDGSYWRSLFPLNADEPSEESEKWEKIGDIFAQKTYALSGLTDVDLTGKYEGAILKYDEDQQVWRPGQYAPDYRNFRGDWQDPADTLLWSTDFSDPADLDLFVPSSTAEYTYGTEYTKSLRTADQVAVPDSTAYLNAARFALGDTGLRSGSALFTLDVAQIPEISGRYISKMKFEEAMRADVSTNNLGTRFVGYGNSGRFTQFYIPTAGIGWRTREVIYDSGSFGPAWSLEDYSTSSSVGRYLVQYFVTGIQVYGALDNEDLYRLNDVVAHNGFFWRSLFPLNSDEPTEESEKWEKISEFVVNGHLQPQGAGRIDRAEGPFTRSNSTYASWGIILTAKENVWVSGVTAYLGGGGVYGVTLSHPSFGDPLASTLIDSAGTGETAPEWLSGNFEAPVKLKAGAQYLLHIRPETNTRLHYTSTNHDGEFWRRNTSILGSGIHWWDNFSQDSNIWAVGFIEYGDPAP